MYLWLILAFLKSSYFIAYHAIVASSIDEMQYTYILYYFSFIEFIFQFSLSLFLIDFVLYVNIYIWYSVRLQGFLALFAWEAFWSLPWSDFFKRNLTKIQQYAILRGWQQGMTHVAFVRMLSVYRTTIIKLFSPLKTSKGSIREPQRWRLVIASHVINQNVVRTLRSNPCLIANLAHVATAKLGNPSIRTVQGHHRWFGSRSAPQY